MAKMTLKINGQDIDMDPSDVMEAIEKALGGTTEEKAQPKKRGPKPKAKLQEKSVPNITDIKKQLEDQAFKMGVELYNDAASKLADTAMEFSQQLEEDEQKAREIFSSPDALKILTNMYAFRANVLQLQQDLFDADNQEEIDDLKERIVNGMKNLNSMGSKVAFHTT